MPTTFDAPLMRAICAATEPVAPAAPDTSTTSPSFGWPTSSRPKYAVRPVMPKIESACSGVAPGGSLVTLVVIVGRSRSTWAYSCQPAMPDTMSPTASFGEALSTTCPTVAARITSPMPTGGM